MLTVIYGTEYNQDGYYYKEDNDLDNLRDDMRTYQIYRDNQLVYQRNI